MWQGRSSGFPIAERFCPCSLVSHGFPIAVFVGLPMSIENLQISFPGQLILTDVVVSHPLCPSHVIDASRKSLVVAEQAAQRKHRSYDETARLHHMRLLPFSVETMGGLSSEAEQLVDQIGLACRDHMTLETHESIARGVRASVAVAVQKGNAMTVLAGYSRAVMRGGRPSVAIGA